MRNLGGHKAHGAKGFRKGFTSRQAGCIVHAHGSGTLTATKDGKVIRVPHSAVINGQAFRFEPVVFHGFVTGWRALRDGSEVGQASSLKALQRSLR